MTATWYFLFTVIVIINLVIGCAAYKRSLINQSWLEDLEQESYIKGMDDG